jgi:hypothetical protein
MTYRLCDMWMRKGTDCRQPVVMKVRIDDMLTLHLCIRHTLRYLMNTMAVTEITPVYARPKREQ